jgi:hypothetical protein
LAIDDLLEPIHHLILNGFRRQPLFVPVSLDGFRRYWGPWRSRLDPRLSLLAFDGGEVVGLLLAHPEISRNSQGQWTDVCLITHQASAVLVDHWQKMINPGNMVQTIEKYANMVQCSVPLNLAYATLNPAECNFTQTYLLTLSLGPDMHANAALFRRNF